MKIERTQERNVFAADAQSSDLMPRPHGTLPRVHTYPFFFKGIKLTAKTVDEDPAGCKRWISRKEM